MSGEAWRGTARPGRAMLGKDSFELVVVPRIMAWRCVAWRGKARRGSARQGFIFNSILRRS